MCCNYSTGYIKPGLGRPYIDEMDVKTFNGEPVADPRTLIRLTLRGHYVRWRLERELAQPAPACAPPTQAAPHERPLAAG